ADAGKYQATCKPGMTGSGIRSDFMVTGSAAKQSDANALKARATTLYADYVANNASALEEETAKFVASVKAGKADEAKAAYARTRVYYERIEPVAEKFGDLDPAIEGRDQRATADPGAEGPSSCVHFGQGVRERPDPARRTACR